MPGHARAGECRAIPSLPGTFRLVVYAAAYAKKWIA
jgi:hypothetical protein